MRAIYKIARLELLNLFYSPVAWLVLIIFVFMTASHFTGVLDSMSLRQELGRQTIGDITKSIFYPEIAKGVWDRISELFYILMPLLTMGLISQEFTRGSIKLLFSAPISSYQIILGKYLGIVFYGLLMVLIAGLYVFVSSLYVENFDLPAVLTGVLGLFLLLCLYAAIGLFMSGLTTYPIISAIAMIAMLTFLGMVSSWWQEYNFVRDITYWLSIGGRTKSFIKGMITSEDVLYFIIISGMFIGFAILSLQLRREHTTFTGKATRYLGVFAIAIFLGYITSRPSMKVYYDATYSKNKTLAVPSQEIVSQLDGDLKITTYVNLFGPIYSINTKGIRGDIARYEQYIRFKPEIKMDYQFYYDIDTTSGYFRNRFPNKTLREAAQDMAKMNDTRLSKYMTPDEMKARLDLTDEGHRFVALIERGNGQKTWLRVFDDMYRIPFEEEISAALKRLAMPLPRVGFLSDHGARNMTGDKNRDYSFMVSEKTNRFALINQGFTVAEISLARNANELGEVDVLVVSEPLEPFTEQEIQMLTRFIDEGNNLIIAGKPKTSTYLEPLFELLGVRFETGMLVHEYNENFYSNLIQCCVTEEARDLSRLWRTLYHYTVTSSNPNIISMPGASAIEVVEDKGFKVIPMLETTKDSIIWNELQTIDFINEVATCDPSTGEREGKRTTMLGLEREKAGKKQRIVIVGDADSFSMGEIQTRRRFLFPLNGELIMAMFNWLSYEELPIDTAHPRPIDNKLKLSMDGAAVVATALKWIIPGLLLLFAVFVLLRRRGK